jgi:tetratricopeptide (TPR) repeat protein
LDRKRARWIAAGGAVLLAGIAAGLFFALRGAPPRGAEPSKAPTTSPSDVRYLLSSAKSELENLHPDRALPILQQAVQQYATELDARLDLANVYLLLDRSNDAIEQANEALKLDPASAPAYYVAGSAHLRLQQYEPAVKALSDCQHIDPNVAAVNFQLGRAYQGLGQFQAARDALEQAIKLEPQHPSAHYVLSQVLLRLGKQDDAAAELARHKAILAKRPNVQITTATFERCVHTQLRVPFRATEEPSGEGIKVTFSDATANAFGAARYHGPVGIIDPDGTNRCGLFVIEGDHFRVLGNTGGKFKPIGDALPALAGEEYRRVLVGDLNNDGIDDCIVLGDHGARAFLLSPGGAAKDITPTCGLADVVAGDGALADLDFTGKLGLWVASPDGNSVRFFRNQGNLTFKDTSAEAGAPSRVTGIRRMLVTDWDTDDLPDLLLSRENQPPLLLHSQRGGPVKPDDILAYAPAGAVIAAGDVNNDLRTDLVVARPSRIEILYNGLKDRAVIDTGDFSASSIYLIDYDNDGWLDLVAAGDGLRVWRNLGRAGFKEVTAELGLDKLVKGHVNSVTAADFDGDGATDLLLDIEGTGLQLLHNNGGNANRQLKLRLIGKRSNASALGSRVVLSADGWRTSRMYDGFPLEIGVGRHQTIDTLTVHWFDLAVTIPPDLSFDPKRVVALTEIQLPTGSCPYLYAWDGKRFRFVSDILGASPAGLPAAAGHLIDADTDELVWLGDESLFAPRNGQYVVQITDELREILYLDEAKLVVADHPRGTEVHPTSKLRPRKPFPPAELVVVGDRVPLLRATRLDGTDVTDLLTEIDGKVVSPQELREPQLRGLAEPHGVVVDFGPLDGDQPLVLVLTGWLHFGGGMANIAASENPDLPFPFPTLETQTPDGWKRVNLDFGAPAGKTKTILVDLTGKLPPGSRALRITTAFEIHWDRIALFRSAATVPSSRGQSAAPPRISAATTPVAHWLSPTQTDVHWRGFSQYADLPWSVPLTPIYDQVSPTAPWRINPSGWCTRYGPVDELIAAKDDALVIMNAGDELTLRFDATKFPPKTPNTARDFFLFTSGWDKDADYHVVRGWTVDPLPWHAMDDQAYGHQPRPALPADDQMRKYNTRWVGPLTLPRKG